MIYQQGVLKKNLPNLTPADVVRIERRGTTIEYQCNGAEFYTPDVPSSTRLHLDLAFYDHGAEIKDLSFSNPAPFIPTPWETYTYDANDNAGHTHPASAAGYHQHWNTPASAVVDAFGRPVATIVRTGPNPQTNWYTTRSTCDIQGNLLTVTDALERMAFRYVYDLTPKGDEEDNGVNHTGKAFFLAGKRG